MVVIEGGGNNRLFIKLSWGWGWDIYDRLVLLG